MSGPDRELVALQTVRLRGRIDRAEIDPDLADTVDGLVKAGLLAEVRTLRLTDQGRARLRELLAAERADADVDVANRIYAEFEGLNGHFKTVVSQWQIAKSTPGDEVPVREDDADRDAAVVAEVSRVHDAVVPIIVAASGQIPRLGAYVDRLGAALRRAADGDLAWLSRPTIDSYHTLWFALHEELIGLAGRTRGDADT